MAYAATTSKNPTISEFIQTLHPPIPGLNREKVVAAAKARGVTIKDGRIDRDNLADIYFELSDD